MLRRSETHDPDDPPGNATHRRRFPLAVVAVVALAVAAHLALGGLLLTAGPWQHWAGGIVVAVIVVHVLGRFLRRGGKVRKTR
ncbi:hypothetical protein SAMN05421748_13728 [Paractinoplanes atraurantiacus]|uniref:Uncharacterized protein n=1 Tax=Paractinoplanes atraurantiacus TaxID=1036182 RepID=A0A285KFF6_9ACTN|nr:hypothetical protein SAMN05421748_13728 [Actinoplanes atraurantiacus]